MRRPCISREHVVVLLAVLAGLSFVAGAWMIYPPAGLIVAGLSFLAAAVEVQSEDPRASR